MNEDTTLLERFGELRATARAAHQRIDKIEIGVREDLKDINSELKNLSGHIERSKGRDSVLIFISGLVGAGFSKLLAHFL